MRKRVGWGLAVVLGLAVTLGPGCRAVDYVEDVIGGGYDLEIIGNGFIVGELRQLCVIVAREDDVAKLQSEETSWVELTEEKNTRKYLSYSDYKPREMSDDDDAWEVVTEATGANKRVACEVDEESINVRFLHTILDKSEGVKYTVLVLAFYKDGELDLAQIPHDFLESNASHILRVGRSEMVLTLL